ncbi:MAG: D-xylose ABC transporter ATP-binding protein [Spirochaetes bacterium]|nr:MAG: D-xylose ABC transporter ATP-binding protein [Spirochaetota bacterium]
MSDDFILEMDNVTKEFPGVVALSDVSFNVKRGEIHGICGENGAGKSTLMKILSGVYPHETYTGKIVLDGKMISFEKGAIRQAIESGISIVYQELALNPFSTVGENIFLGREPVRFGDVINWNDLYGRTKKLLTTYGLEIPFGETVGNLGVGKQQMVEIAKSLSEDAKVLILDEPTSALNQFEVNTLHAILRTLKEKGVTCVYISHKLEEFFQITDTVTVLRDGKHVATIPTAETNTDKLIAMMVGREMTERFPSRKVEIGEPVFTVKDYKVMSTEFMDKTLIQDVSFDLKKGEILGIAGLMGSGRTELVTSLFGEMGKQIAGIITLNGKEININSARDAMNHNIGLVPEDRKRLGLILEQSILKNISLPSMDHFSGFMHIDKNKELEESRKFAKSLRIKTPNLLVPAEKLSGGNQQKVVISKWLMTNPDVLILDDPTRGIDVGAKYEIYKLMNDLVERGVSIIMISSELEEVLGMSDRIMVMCEGRSTGILDIKEATQERIMALATAGAQDEKEFSC